MSLQRGFTLAAAETEITRRLLAGEHVLLIGAAKTNLPTQLADHPQVDLWDSECRMRRVIPSSARIVLFTKWVGHNQHKWIREDAAKDRARFIWPELLGTGEIRRLLQPLLPASTEPAPVVVAPVETPAKPGDFDYDPPAPAPPTCTVCVCGTVPGVTWGGSTREFVEQHWNHDVEHIGGWQSREAKRLHRLAAQHGLSCTLHYIEKLVSQLNIAREQSTRDEAALTQERRALANGALANEKIEQQLRHAVERPTVAERVEQWLDSTEVVAPPPVVVVDAGEARISAELGELLRMIDDAAAVLSLARETIVQLAKENSEQRNMRDRVRAKMQAALDSI